MRFKILYLLLFVLVSVGLFFAVTRSEAVLDYYVDLVKPSQSEVDRLTSELEAGSVGKELLADDSDELIDGDDIELVNLNQINFYKDQTTLNSGSQDTGHRLIIPRMGVDDSVLLNDDAENIKRGLWHIPGSAYPGENGNIVIAAHRWLYKPPSTKTFYLIEDLEIGDKIFYEYDNTRFTYVVREFNIVDPTAVKILKQNENRLTLFTCHPLFSIDQRYVVEAVLFSTKEI